MVFCEHGFVTWARQIIEPLVLLRFHFALPRASLSLCLRMLFSSCAVHYRVEGSQIHHTSHISRGLLLQGWLVSEENEVSQPRAPLVPSLEMGSYL